MTVEQLVSEFYSDGRGPELQQVVWTVNGSNLVGFEYFNPDVEYKPENLMHLILQDVRAYQMSLEEIHSNIQASTNSKAAIFEIIDSSWLKTFKQDLVKEYKHFQIIFYDEIFDVVCKHIKCGRGRIA